MKKPTRTPKRSPQPVGKTRRGRPPGTGKHARERRAKTLPPAVTKQQRAAVGAILDRYAHVPASTVAPVAKRRGRPPKAKPETTAPVTVVAPSSTSKRTTAPPPASADVPVPRLLGRHGDTGLNRYGGIIAEEWLQELVGSAGIRMYREIADNEPTLGAALRAQELLISAAKIRVDPAKGTDNEARAKQVADFVQSCIDDLQGGWSGFVDEALTCLVYGWAYLEKLFRVRIPSAGPYGSMNNDGRIGWERFALCAHASLDEWDLDERGRTMGMWQRPPSGGTRLYVPREKALHIRIKPQLDNPEGRSTLRIGYTTYYNLKIKRFAEAVGIEKALVGMPVMEVPRAILADPTSVAATRARSYYEKLVKHIRIDEDYGAVIPAENENNETTGYRLRLLAGGGTRPIDTNTVIQRDELRLLQTQLAEFLNLGNTGEGSHALSSDKTTMFARACGALLSIIIEPLNREAIPELVTVNGWPREYAPKIVPGDLESLPLAEVSAFLSGMIGVGAITPDRKLEDHLRTMANLPPVDELAALTTEGAGT